jgi:hypothetical protein
MRGVAPDPRRSTSLASGGPALGLQTMPKHRVAFSGRRHFLHIEHCQVGIALFCVAFTQCS